jgi:hypothetical protein
VKYSPYDLGYFAKIFCGLLLAAALCAGCAATPKRAPLIEDREKSPELLQTVTLRALDARDRPLKGVRLVIEPISGSPVGQGPFVTNEKGEITFKWRARAKDRTKGTMVLDRDYIYETIFRFRTNYTDFAQYTDKVVYRDVRRRVVTPELTMLNRDASLPPISRVMVLHRLQDILGRGMDPDQSGLTTACLNFFKNIQLSCPFLGVRFAWPSFSLAEKKLTVRFHFKHPTWGVLETAPFLAQTTINSALPLAIACGDDLLPLPEITHLTLAIEGEISPPDDPYAAPKRVENRITAPQEAFKALAVGTITPDDFLEKYPPVLLR